MYGDLKGQGHQATMGGCLVNTCKERGHVVVAAPASVQAAQLVKHNLCTKCYTARPQRRT